MKTTVSQIKRFVLRLDPNKIRLIAALATIAAAVINGSSPGAGSGIGG